MHTLDVISPNLYHTGSDNMSRLINALPNMFLNENDELLKEIAAFQHPASIPMSMHERLKKDHNLALMYGAIRIPIIHHSCNEETFHEVRISFSGGSQEEDLITCFLIFRELQEALLNVYNDSYFTYILNPLKEDRHCYFNLKLFNLKECYPKQ